MEKEKNMLETVISVINTIVLVVGAILNFGMGYHYMWLIACFIIGITTVIEKSINKKTNEKEFKICLCMSLVLLGYIVYKICIV